MGSNDDHDQKGIDTHTKTFCVIDAVENALYAKEIQHRKARIAEHSRGCLGTIKYHRK